METHSHIDPSRRGGVRGAVRPGGGVASLPQSLSYNIILSGGASWVSIRAGGGSSKKARKRILMRERLCTTAAAQGLLSAPPALKGLERAKQ